MGARKVSWEWFGTDKFSSVVRFLTVEMSFVLALARNNQKPS